MVQAVHGSGSYAKISFSSASLSAVLEAAEAFGEDAVKSATILKVMPSDDITEHQPQLLRDILERYQEVEEIDFSGIDLSNAELLQVVTEYIGNNLHLKNIRLNRCNIGDSGFATLLEALSKHSLIGKLELNGNNLTDYSAENLFHNMCELKPCIIDATLREGNSIEHALIAKIDSQERLTREKLMEAISQRKLGKDVGPSIIRILEAMDCDYLKEVQRG